MSEEEFIKAVVDEAEKKRPKDYSSRGSYAGAYVLHAYCRCGERGEFTGEDENEALGKSRVGGWHWKAYPSEAMEPSCPSCMKGR